LVIKPPQSLTSARRIEGAVRNLDIMPTVLDYCGIRPPEDIDGRSLRPCIEKNLSVDLPASMESNTPEKGIHLVGYRRNGQKVIYRRNGPAELYDLVNDPGERVNLLDSASTSEGQPTEAVARREAELRKGLLATYGVGRVEDLLYTYFPDQIDPRNRERLKALGYIY
jgi:arylsulfatase A-like enzyme